LCSRSAPRVSRETFPCAGGRGSGGRSGVSTTFGMTVRRAPAAIRSATVRRTPSETATTETGRRHRLHTTRDSADTRRSRARRAGRTECSQLMYDLRVPASAMPTGADAHSPLATIRHSGARAPSLRRSTGTASASRDRRRGRPRVVIGNPLAAAGTSPESTVAETSTPSRCRPSISRVAAFSMP
jgi:hypothetical protein